VADTQDVSKDCIAPGQPYWKDEKHISPHWTPEKVCEENYALPVWTSDEDDVMVGA
jgi:hypothetical protein